MQDGNPQIENGHIDIANEIAEALARTELNGYESRYLWVLWRKTYGWHKKEDIISNSQFVEATGIKKQHIWRTEQRLIQRKIVTKNGNKLRFNKHYKDWLGVTKNGYSKSEELPKMVTVTKNGYNISKTLVNKGLPEKVTKNGYAEKVTKFGIKVTKNGYKLKEKKVIQRKERSKETIQKKKEKNSSELKKSSPSSSITFSFSKEDWEGITDSDISKWGETYPACNIKIELLKMADWLLSNPNKKKKNYRRFISNWLTRTQDRGGTKRGMLRKLTKGEMNILSIEDWKNRGME